jgi:type II secretory pathway pseudopilin PulG
MASGIQRRFGRTAFTLIELLVVISIIIIMATLTVIYVIPAFQDNKSVIRGVDRVTQTLLIAKQKAMRDRAPRGVRFIVDQKLSNLTANPPVIIFSQMQFVEQPEVFANGTCQGTGGGPSTTLTFTFPGVVGFKGGASVPDGAYDQYLVQPGDYLEMNGGGPVFKIAGVTDTTLTLTSPQTFGQTTNYRIFRQGRPTSGEDILTLPQNVVVDNSKKPDLTDKFSLNVPARTMTSSGNSTLTYYEVMFSPSGGLVVGTGCGNVVLWVRDITIEPYEFNTSRLIAIGYRTGFIAGHPVSPGVDPYAFTKDGRASGF